MTFLKETYLIIVLKLVTSLVLEYQCRFDFVTGSFFVGLTMTGDISGTKSPIKVG